MPFLPRLFAAFGQSQTEYAAISEPDTSDVYLREFEDTENAAAQENWLAKYQNEMKHGNKILQFEMHLRAKILHIKNLAEQQSPAYPMLVDELYSLDKQLTAANRDYLQHQQRLSSLDDDKAPGRLVREFLTRRHRRPSARWEAGRASCRLRGGCCARDCGCCELWSAMRQHMHCGSDCDCCMRHREAST